MNPDSIGLTFSMIIPRWMFSIFIHSIQFHSVDIFSNDLILGIMIRRLRCRIRSDPKRLIDICQRAHCCYDWTSQLIAAANKKPNANDNER